MGKYDAEINDAYNDILAAGTLATLSRVTSSYDAVAGEKIVTAIQTDSVAVVSFPASSGTVQAFDNRIVEEYKKGKIRFFYVAAKGLNFEPEAGDLLFVKNKVWEVAGTTPLDPDCASPILYTLGAKVSNLSALPTVA